MHCRAIETGTKARWERGWIAASAVALLVTSLGCEEPAARGVGVPDAGESAQPSTAREDRSALPTGRLPAKRLAPGTAIVSVASGRVSVEANRAPRLKVLEELAEKADFELVAEDPWMPPLTVSIDDETLREALPLLLGDSTYHTEFRFDEGRNEHALILLVVGETSGSVGATAALAAEEAAARDAGSEEASGTRDEVEDVRQTRDWRDESLESVLATAIEERDGTIWEPEELEAMLADEDPVVRMRAVLEMEPEGPGLEQLSRVLLQDADPRVRAAATASLENSDTYAAVKVLVEALSDPDPEVVVEVIDSLEFAGDDSNVEDLIPLLEHEDVRVREAAAEGIRFLADDWSDE